MNDTRAIGIFDSGIGGLTVVREMIHCLPHENIVYFGDTARVPYGTKSSETVKAFALQDIFFLLEQHVKILIAACHTVSSTVFDTLVSTMHLPMLGVVEPGVKAAAHATRNGRVGVIGTYATVASGSYESKLKAIRKDMHVISKPCPLFVPLAEEGWIDGEVPERVAQTYLAPIQDEGIDTLILGCTHYPLLRPVIERVLGEGVTIIDPAEEIAKLVAKRLHFLTMENQQKEPGRCAYYVSDIPHRFREVGEQFLGMPMTSVTRVEVTSQTLSAPQMHCGFKQAES